MSVGNFTRECVLAPSALTREELWRLFTCSFCHANLIHLLSNLHAFHEIGIAVERTFGMWRYASLIAFSCLSGNVFSICFNSFYGKSGSVRHTLTIGILFITNVTNTRVKIITSASSLRNISYMRLSMQTTSCFRFITDVMVVWQTVWLFDCALWINGSMDSLLALRK